MSTSQMSQTFLVDLKSIVLTIIETNKTQIGEDFQPEVYFVIVKGEKNIYNLKIILKTIQTKPFT